MSAAGIPSSEETESRPLLSVRNLRKLFPVRADYLGRPVSWLSAVDDVSFEVRRGETFGLVGETGSGKSTTAHLVLRLTPVTSGSIYFEGHDVLAADRQKMSDLRRRMQIVFQDPYSSLDPRMRISQIVMEGMHRLDLSRKQRQERVDSLLGMVGLATHYGSRYPHELSGGQRQRVVVARALGVNPDLVVLDEPVSALDVSIQSQVLNLLQDLQRSLNLTYLFISHDLSVVRHVSDRIGVMYLGKLVEIASKESIFHDALHPYTQALLSAIPSVKSATEGRSRRIILEGEIPSPIDPPPHCRFASRCFRAIERCRKETPSLDPVAGAGDHLVACFNYERAKGERA